MKGNTKLIILVVIFVLLLAGLYGMMKKNEGSEERVRQEQDTPFFPGLAANQVFRIDITNLEAGGLLFRKEAGIWEVAQGRDVFRTLMNSQEVSRDSIQPVNLNPDEESESDEDISVEPAEPAEEESPPEPPLDPRDDPGPTGDFTRRFYRAQTDKVDAMIDAMIDLRHGDIVTSDPEKSSILGVLSNILGTEVIFYDQSMNKLAHIIIGNNNNTFTGVFIRESESDEIYEAPMSFKPAYSTSVEMVRSQKIFDHAPETIVSYILNDHERGTQLNLLRSQGIWEGTDGEGNPLILDPQKVDNLLDLLGTLSANSFVSPNERPVPPPEDEEWDETDPYSLLNPTLEVEFTTTDHATIGLTVGRLEGTTYYAAVTGDLMDVFKITTNLIESLRPSSAMLEPGEEVEEGAPDESEGTEEEIEIPPEVLEELFGDQ